MDSPNIRQKLFRFRLRVSGVDSDERRNQHSLTTGVEFASESIFNGIHVRTIVRAENFTRRIILLYPQTLTLNAGRIAVRITGFVLVGLDNDGVKRNRAVCLAFA